MEIVERAAWSSRMLCGFLYSAFTSFVKNPVQGDGHRCDEDLSAFLN
jgi:hypothetical protein